MLFSVLCTAGLVAANLTPGQLPLLIIISPLAILCLLVPRGFLRIE